MKEKYFKKDHIMPGQMVYADYYILRYPVRIYHTKGKPDTYDMFSGGCVFIDHANGYMSTMNQSAINATESVRIKIDRIQDSLWNKSSV